MNKEQVLIAAANLDDLKQAITVFIRYYNFLSQIVSLGDLQLEKFYVY